MAESSLSEARQVQDSSGEMCSHTSVGSSLLDAFREVPVSENINFSSLSLVCDIAGSVDDEFSVSGSPADTLLSSTSPPVTGALQSSKLPHGSGLGISGLTRKDGSGPFDGLGIVSIKSSPWRHDDLPRSEMLHLDQSDFIHRFSQPSSLYSSSTYDDSSESEDFDPSLLVDTGDTGISDVFLQETFFTFTQDPFHQLCHSNIVSSSSIPGCDNSNNSWSELGLGLGDELESTPMSDLLMNTSTHPVNDDSRPQRLNHLRRRIPKLKTNFSSATISSELKRLSNTVFPKSNWRNRSSSWPASTPGTAAAAPRTHCKWRL